MPTPRLMKLSEGGLLIVMSVSSSVVTAEARCKHG